VVGNQRTGFIVGFLFLELNFLELNFLELNFLELNGCRFTAGEEDTAEGCSPWRLEGVTKAVYNF